ncbi:hypothetical protein AVEN_173842-1 [Araneus ventricosus]|uniref:Uncharacterized protein n=1 Tax=Araneus ventricosus TaxID=182803 RepID=A0A4Y2NJ92_ARAVE|nr:hypothetical protein AVEN_140025-1 [Araneus ventricosus]GBN39595.1 hypothetical protein AVEN_173842-1 [Araneus ventricosus]
MEFSPHMWLARLDGDTTSSLSRGYFDERHKVRLCFRLTQTLKRIVILPRSSTVFPTCVLLKRGVNFQLSTEDSPFLTMTRDHPFSNPVVKFSYPFQKGTF